jgi:hypothetical protein
LSHVVDRIHFHCCLYLQCKNNFKYINNETGTGVTNNIQQERHDVIESSVCHGESHRKSRRTKLTIESYRILYNVRSDSYKILRDYRRKETPIPTVGRRWDEGVSVSLLVTSLTPCSPEDIFCLIFINRFTIMFLFFYLKSSWNDEYLKQNFTRSSIASQLAKIS